MRCVSLEVACWPRRVFIVPPTHTYCLWLGDYALPPESAVGWDKTVNKNSMYELSCFITPGQMVFERTRTISQSILVKLKK